MSYHYNVNTLTENCISWIKEWFNQNGDEKTKAIIGISGGKDSTVLAALLTRALGKERVVGAILPNGKQEDGDDAIKVAELLDITTYTINIETAYESITNGMRPAFPVGTGSFPPESFSINTPSRLRMTVLYSLAATMGNSRVANTGNRSESIVGYSTLYGDSAGDFAPFKNLTSDEIVAIGDSIGLPYDLVHKKPSDGMSKDKNGNLLGDEDKLGLTYKDINDFIRNEPSGESKLKKGTKEKILSAFNKNKFKLIIQNIPSFKVDFPDFFRDL